MVKPIGNLVANLAPKDKVSARTKARFGPASMLTPARSAAAGPAATDAPAAPKPVKYKKRKR